MVKWIDKEIKVPDLQRGSQSSAKDVKLKAWDELRQAVVLDALTYSYTTALQMAFGLLGFSITGRKVFKLTSDSMDGDLLSAFNLFGKQEEQKSTIESEQEEQSKTEAREK